MRGEPGFFDVDGRLKLSAKGDDLERMKAIVDSRCFGRIWSAPCQGAIEQGAADRPTIMC
jgi:hypothetical protein